MVFQRKALWVSLAAASLLVACGGGGADTSPVAPIKTVKVMGDSIADSGTFGFKFTVQGSAPTVPASTLIWPELVASNYGSYHGIYEPPFCHAQAKAVFDTVK